MDDRKTTLYLAVLCIILMIWGSVLDGKRLHLKEVLEAENAELVHLVNETRASYAKAASTQEELQNKLAKLQKQLSDLKQKNQELQKINDILKAELEKEKKLRQEAEAKAAEVKPQAVSNSQPATANFAENLQVKGLQERVQQLIREREELQAKIIAERQNAFSSSLKVTELESQLRYCRERMNQLADGAQETRELRNRVRELERQLAERTQELWNTRLSLSADLDTCTRQLMKATLAPPPPPPAPAAAPPVPPCKAGMGKPGPGGKPGCGNCQTPKGQAARGPAKGPGGCSGCIELKNLKMQLDACSTRLESLQKQFKESGMRYLEEIAQLKKAIMGNKSGETPKPVTDIQTEGKLPPPEGLKITCPNEEIQKLKAEIEEKEKELAQYKKNTEALLEQIREQRAQIKRLKAGK